MSHQPRRGHKPPREAADVSARIKTIGRRGAQIYVPKAGLPQTKVILEDLELSRVFVLAYISDALCAEQRVQSLDDDVPRLSHCLIHEGPEGEIGSGEAHAP